MSKDKPCILKKRLNGALDQNIGLIILLFRGSLVLTLTDPVLLFRLPGEWQVRSDRPFCRSPGNGQAATLLQSNILLKTCRYRDII